jgi:hypothetical protein
MKKLSLALSIMMFIGTASAEVVEDLSGWDVDGTGDWSYSSVDNSWFQNANTSVPTILFDPASSALGNAVSGEVTVSAGDDDMIGFVLGYKDGDNVNVDADYWLVSWKGLAQSGWGEGLAFYHVTGALQNGESMWNPYNHSSINEIARGNNFGNTGWDRYETYSFDITYEHNLISLFVNENLELSLTTGMAGVSEFKNGGFGFYAFSQPGITYGGVVYDEIANVVTEEQVAAAAAQVPFSGTALGSLVVFGLAFSRIRKNT